MWIQWGVDRCSWGVKAYKQPTDGNTFRSSNVAGNPSSLYVEVLMGLAIHAGFSSQPWLPKGVPGEALKWRPVCTWNYVSFSVFGFFLGFLFHCFFALLLFPASLLFCFFFLLLCCLRFGFSLLLCFFASLLSCFVLLHKPKQSLRYSM